MRSFLALLVFASTAFAQQCPPLRTLTYNVWMVKKLGVSISSKYENERLPYIIEGIRKSGAQLVALQEVWNYPIRARLITALSREYPYAFHSGDFLFGMSDGMLLLSKYPLVYRHRPPQPSYADAKVGLPTTEIDAEKFIFGTWTAPEEFPFVPNPFIVGPLWLGVSKGAARVAVQIPCLGATDVILSHLGAVQYDEEAKNYLPSQLKARKKQAYELSRFIITRRNVDRPLIMMVDLNTHYYDWKDGESQNALSYEYALMTSPQQGLGLKDSYFEANGIDPAMNSPATLSQFTFDPTTNVNAGGGMYSDTPPEFIDYIFYWDIHHRLKPSSGTIIFKEPVVQVESRHIPMSDHYGVLVDFQVRR